MRRILFSLAMSAALLVLPAGKTASAADWQGTVAAAEKEGAVALYTSLLPIQVERLSAAFAKAFPRIQLQVTRNTENILTQKILQEQAVSAKGADVLIMTNMDFIDEQLANGNIIKPAGKHASTFARTRFLYRDYAPVVASYYVVLAYNSEVVKKAPAQFADVVAPDRDYVVGLTAVESGSGAALYYDILRRDIDGYWAKLAKKSFKIYPGSVPLAQAVASGEVSIAMYGVPPALTPLIAKGAPIKVVSPSDARAVGGTFAAQILKNAKSPSAAQVLVEWLISPEGQLALNGDGLGMANSPDVPGALAQKDFVLLDTKIYDTARVKEINAEWRAVFGGR